MPQGPLTAATALTPSNAAALLKVDASGNLLIESAAGGISVKPQGASAYNDATGTAGHSIKTGAGVFQGFTTNTAGTSSTAVLYDGTSTAGTKLATINTATVASLQYNIAFATGLFIVSSTATPADITVAYF